MRLSHERSEEVLTQLSETSTPSFDFFFLSVLSATIATFGLITDSAAVIIGAMLVAPLMSPILGLSLASVAGRQLMFRHALTAIAQGVLLSVLVSTALSWLALQSPFDVLRVLPVELQARTHPTPFDLVIALAGGAAAAYALAQKHLSAALPGVAIATAIMPPLCTVGIGISLLDANVAGGAALLFLTNLAAIAFAGIVVFASLGFRPSYQNRSLLGLQGGLWVSALLVLFVTGPLVGLSLRFVNEGRLERQVRAAVSDEVSEMGDFQVVEVDITSGGEELNLAVTIRAFRQLTYLEVVQLQMRLADRLRRTVALQVFAIPTIKLDPLFPPTPTPVQVLDPTATSTPVPTSTQVPASPTSTPTLSPTITTTSTPTETSTPTPETSFILNSGGVFLRESPGGRAFTVLPAGTAVHVLYQRSELDGVEWVEVRDSFGRTGWVPLIFLSPQP